MHPAIRAILTLTAIIACIGAPSVTLAQDQVYEIDGYQLSSEGVARLRVADDQKTRGIEALGRGDWASALRLCESALDGYRRTGVPGHGAVGEVYRQGRACAADALARLGRMDEACDRYRDIGYHTLMSHSPRGTCEAREAAEEASIQAWDDYANAFATFSSSTAALQTFPADSEQRSHALDAVVSSCGRLQPFSRLIEGAPAAVSYCNAIVLFEGGDFAGACAELRRGRSGLSTLDFSALPSERARHVRALATTLDGFRSICEATPSAW